MLVSVTSSMMPTREVILAATFCQFVEYAFDHRGREFFRRQTVAAADDLRERFQRKTIVRAAFAERGDDVHVERFAGGAGLFGAVKNGDRLGGGGQSLNEVLNGERTIQANFEQADLLAFRDEILNRFLRNFCARSHDDDDALGVRCANVIEQLVLTSGDLRELVHRVLHDGGNRQVEGVHGFASLEVDVRILRSAAKDRAIRRERACAMLLHQFVGDHRLQIFFGELLDLGHFVRGTEAVEEVHEGDARFQRRCLRDQCRVHHFLHRVRSEQGPSGLAHGHHVLVIAEDRESLCCEGARRNVHDRGRKFAGDLVHVGDHQQQSLGGGEGCGERAGLQSAVKRSGSSAFALHFNYEGNRVPDVGLVFGRPLVGPFAHRRGWGDRIDCDDFVDLMRDVCGRFVSINRYF